MSLPPPSPELVARYVEADLWQGRCVHELVDEHAERTPAKEAMCDQTRRLRYADLVAESTSLARFLLDLGVGRGDCVAVQSGNAVELVVAHLACSRVDATFVPLSDAWRQTELRHLLTVSRAPVILVPPAGERDFLAEAESIRASLPALRFAASFGGDGDADLRTVLARRAEPVAVETDASGPRYVMASSGTTNVPKLSLWSDDNLWAFHRAWAEAVELGPDDRTVGLAPAGTGAIGYVYGVLFPLLAGGTSVLVERWEPAAALELIARERPTVLAAVPTQIVKLLQHPASRTLRPAELRAVTNAGAPMPPEAAAELEERWSCRIQTVYGATDGGVPLMTRLDDPAEKRRTTVGRVLPLTDLLLVDGDLRPVAPGEPGEILWRGPTKSFGYLNDPERTEEMFPDGFYRSGDLGALDADGYLRIVGRAKDLIIRGGQNISPREVEEAVGAHPAVAEAAAVGVPDPVYGERVCVAVALRDGRTLELAELVSFLELRQIATFKLPERLEIFAELPRNASGKTSKDDVRRLVAERTAAARPASP